jgi:hypothetical protein
LHHGLLDQDAPLERHVERPLNAGVGCPHSERQLELIGNEGVEKFSAVFCRDARTVVI